jgi:hypothetical protein
MNMVTEHMHSDRLGAVPCANPRHAARLAERIRAEFREMPGMKLTLNQATRVFGLDARQSQCLLRHLLDEGFLVCDGQGAFRRLDVWS